MLMEQMPIGKQTHRNRDFGKGSQFKNILTIKLAAGGGQAIRFVPIN
jgi:hypothetical protein